MGELNMQKTEKIDLTKLLGFETIREPTDDIDFQDETLCAKLGAKVGSIEAVDKAAKPSIERISKGRRLRSAPFLFP